MQCVGVREKVFWESCSDFFGGLADEDDFFEIRLFGEEFAQIRIVDAFIVSTCDEDDGVVESLDGDFECRGG